MPQSGVDLPAAKICMGPCGEEKPLEEFYRQAAGRYGRQSICKVCERARVKDHPNKKINNQRSYQRNKEKVNARSKQWHKDNPDRARELGKTWRKNNPEKVKEYAAGRDANEPRWKEQRSQWRINNLEHTREYARGWRRQNRDKAKIWERARRARKRGATRIPYTAEQLSGRWKYYGNKCWMCGEPASTTDHVKPLSKGGADMLCNLRPACRSCNSRKRDTWPFAAVLESLGDHA